MVRLLTRRVSDHLARTLRPDDLPAVEPELASRPPRPFVWAARSWAMRTITDGMRALLVEGRAVRAWVTHHASQRDGEGTGHLVQYAFEVDGGIRHGHWRGEFDDIHLVMGSNDYSRWLHRAFLPGGTFTVLFEDPDDPTIYGNMELYIEEDLVGLAGRLRRDPGSETLAEQVLRMVLAPVGLPLDERDEYLSLLDRLGLDHGHVGKAWSRNREHLGSAIASGSHDAAALERLGELVRPFAPGIWAAR
jgi:hypothetical protein